MSDEHTRKPSWLKVKLPKGQVFKDVQKLVKGNSLVTVCEEAMCPNRGECWSHGTATFMVCGDVCTRACGFCATRTAKPKPLDPEEPAKVADAVARMNLNHTVVTMVTRDDLPDGAAGHIAATIREIRKASPHTIIEVLTSDFNGKEASLATVMEARPHIFNHNLETVERLSPLVRFRAKYRLSLQVLKRALEMAPGMVVTKSGIMLGLGETRDEIERTMDDLREHGVTVLTMGQYLRPSPRHLPVIDYLRPELFDELREVALSKGFRHVASGPLIRSSHHDANFRPELDILDAINADLRARGEIAPE
ncbi:MAG: lipoyl synthase [Akkermansia sp.]|nr:lipoyl synthase [Akkermansia sp.]